MEFHKGIKGQPYEEPARDHLGHEPILHNPPHAKPRQAQWEKRPEIHGVAREPRDALVQVIERPGQRHCSFAVPISLSGGLLEMRGIQHRADKDVEILK